MVHSGLRLLLLTALLALVPLALRGGGSTPGLAEAQSSRHEIWGTVVDEDGRPVDGLWVAAHLQGGAPGEGQGRSTATGSFRFNLVAGVYRLEIHTERYGVCRVSGLENAEKRLNVIFAAEPGTSSRIDLVVRTSSVPERGGWVPCYFDDAFHTVEGIVLGPDQQPLEGIDARLWRRSGSVYVAPRTGKTGPDGVFAVEVPQGTYRLQLTTRVEGGRECPLGYFGPDGKRAPAGAVTQFSVGTEDIAGLTIALIEPPSEACREVRGVVTDAEGNAVTRASLNFFGHGESQTQLADDAGVFRAYLRDGSYRVTITTDRGSDCIVEGYAGRVPTRGSGFVVDGEGLSGLRFVLSGAPREERRRVPCLSTEVITTELEPGWNLVGWTGAETEIASVFDATRQVTAIYVWDGATQSFRGAARQESEVSGSLKALQPGMGLWLRVGGTERVSWTRPLLTESALVSLVDGWNLVSWSGRDGATAGDIFNSLGEEPAVAATWDASQGEFLVAFAGAGPDLHVKRGDALWLHTSGEGRWLQPGWPAPDVVMLGDYPPGTEERYRRSIEGTQVFYAERYGVITSDVTFYFASDRESLENAYSQVVGRNPPPPITAPIAATT